MREEEEKLRLLREQGHAKRKELIEQGNELKKAIQVQLFKQLTHRLQLS